MSSDDRPAQAPAGGAPQPRTAERYSSKDIARLRNGSRVYPVTSAGSAVVRHLSMKATNAQRTVDARLHRRRLAACAAAFIVLFFFALCPLGAAGQYYVNSSAYTMLSPLEVLQCIYLHAYQLAAAVTHAFDPHTGAWLNANAPYYWAFEKRFLVVAATSVCAVLLSVSGMLFQNVFKNPIAGPGMLGVSSGVSVGLVVLVYLYGSQAEAMLQTRYALCYACGLAMLVLVLLTGWLIARKGGGFKLMNMLLAGMIMSQLLGFAVSYVTLFLMEPADYLVYFSLSQMLVVSTEPFSWLCLGAASLAAIAPIYLLRFKMNALSFDELEARSLGVRLNALRAVALVCGSIMILTALMHTGAVGLVSVIVPFVARGVFGCEFRQQLAGNICLSGLFLLACRCIVDLVPFVGDGIAIGSMAGVVALPVFLVLMARQTRGWE